MAHFQKSITIDAPVHQVFEYWKNPGNWPEVWPSMIEINDLKLTPNGVGTSENWVYKMAGKRFRGHGEFIDCVPDRRIATKDSGDIESSFIWTFEPEGSGTKMMVDAEYTVPIPLLGKLVEPFVLKMNEHEADVTLANLKARMEHRL